MARSETRESSTEDLEEAQIVAAYRRKLVEVRRHRRQEAERLAAALASDGAQKVILFGSMAHGADAFDSDIDLVAISDAVGDVPFHQRAAEALVRHNPTMRVDLLIYTPEEWEALVRSRRFVRDEIAGRGTVLYERAR
ncbi:MAG: nucleotidyltransferase domain-containing protein [Firmicutes bacterium]|nr:nucleotidyltransferase domain-containing protein [Bacillota bacterium]